MKNNKLVKAYATPPVLTEWKKQAKTKSEDIISNGLFGNLVYPFSSNRAGIATGMAKALGSEKEDIPFSVKHPQTASTLSSLLGAGLGAAGGYGLGEVLDSDNKALTTMIGAGSGSVLGHVLNTLVRKSDQKDIREEYDKAELEELDPKKPDESGALMNILNTYGGPHRYSQKQIHDLIEAEKSNPDGLQDFVDELATNRNIGNSAVVGVDAGTRIAGSLTGNLLLRLLGALPYIPHGIRSNIRANDDKSMYAEYSENTERKESPKYNKNKA